MPQARERVFTVSVLNGERFEFNDLIRTPMRNLQEFLEDDASVPDVYDVTQPSVLACIGGKGIRRATVITDCAYTITTRQDRTPAQVIDRGDGRYRYLTERECWRLMGYRRGFQQSESSSAEEREILQSTIRPSRKQHRRSNIREHIQKNNIA